MKLPFSRRSGEDPLKDTKVARALAKTLVSRADAARDERQFQQAAFLYGEALRLVPNRGDLYVQHGHMLKETGAFDAAGEAYQRGLELMPHDADLAAQLGHLYKLQGRPADAANSYRRALALRPGWLEVRRELEALARAGLEQPDILGKARAAVSNPRSIDAPTIGFEGPLRLSAALAPGLPLDTLHAHGEEIALRYLGKRERTPWGVMYVARGVQAFRGFCVSVVPMLQVDISLNGQRIHRGGLKGGFVLPHERENPLIRKYAFNAWVDLTGFVEGRYEIRFRATDINGRAFERTEYIVIAPTITSSALPESDTNVPPADPADPRSLDAQINARASMIRKARRALFNTEPRTVLVLRPDVLGDLVVAVPALKRLRGLFPGARIVGLLSPANVDLARTLGLFDEIVLTELLFDPWERRRVVTADAQKKLAADLAKYQFDIAIDLGTSPDSRLLMPLSRAPVLVGFRADDLPGLTVEVTGGTADPWNGHHNVPHTNMAMGLMEWLGAMMRSEPNLLRREDLDPKLLTAFGLGQDARYIVLHAGGRWEFARWPHYLELAQMLLEHTDLHVVFMTTDPDASTKLPSELASNGRFQLLQRRLAFDELDALLSFCSLFVGDDSGVKHLAAMRGAKVIAIQNARNNWSEWGQENGGFIITRRVPCAGCLIQNYPESDECGRDFVCITAITPDEVLSAAQRLLASGD